MLNPESQALLTQLLCGCQQISPSCCISVTQASLAYSLICCVSSWQQALVSSCFIPPVLLNHLFYGSPYILHDCTQYNKTLLLQKHYLMQFHLYLNRQSVQGEGLNSVISCLYTAYKYIHLSFLAERVTNNLKELAQQVTPGDIVSTYGIRKAMGISVPLPDTEESWVDLTEGEYTKM